MINSLKEIIQCFYTLALECKNYYNNHKFEINCLVVGHCVIAAGIILGYWCMYLSGTSFVGDILSALVGYIIIGTGVLIIMLPVIFVGEKTKFKKEV